MRHLSRNLLKKIIQEVRSSMTIPAERFIPMNDYHHVGQSRKVSQQVPFTLPIRLTHITTKLDSINVDLVTPSFLL